MGYLAAHDEARRAVGVTSLIQTPSVASPSHSHLLASPLSFCGALRSCGATVLRRDANCSVGGSVPRLRTGLADQVTWLIPG